MVKATDDGATIDDDNVRPIRPLDEAAALEWLRAQPGGRTSLSDAELARRWGWNRKRVGRRIKAWAKSGPQCRQVTDVQPADAVLAHVAERHRLDRLVALGHGSPALRNSVLS
jgi:hypothetical protein